MELFFVTEELSLACCSLVATFLFVHGVKDVNNHVLGSLLSVLGPVFLFGIRRFPFFGIFVLFPLLLSGLLTSLLLVSHLDAIDASHLTLFEGILLLFLLQLFQSLVDIKSAGS